MRLVKGTRRYFIVAGGSALVVLFVAVGLFAWHIWQSDRDQTAFERQAKILHQEITTIRGTELKVVLPSDWAPTDTWNGGSCSDNETWLGCWTSTQGTADVAHQVATALAASGLPHPTLNCSTDGRCTILVRVTSVGKLEFLVQDMQTEAQITHNTALRGSHITAIAVPQL